MRMQIGNSSKCLPCPGGEKSPERLTGVMLPYKNLNLTYVPSLIGLDYDYSDEFSVYRQMLFQTVLRARALDFKRIDFGFPASFEKPEGRGRIYTEDRLHTGEG